MGKRQSPVPFGASWWGESAGRGWRALRGGQEVLQLPSRGPCRQLRSKWPVTRLMACVNKRVCPGPLALADDPAAGL